MIERYEQEATHNPAAYERRNAWVIYAMTEAHELGLAAGFRLDPSEPEWPVAYIELPTGQVSWHLPQHPIAWDGHSVEEKYRRIHEYIDAEASQ